MKSCKFSPQTLASFGQKGYKQNRIFWNTVFLSKEDLFYVQLHFPPYLPQVHRRIRCCSGRSKPAGRCQQNGSATIVDVKVGDKVSNWNGLGVQLTSLFNIDTAPAQAGYEYIAVLVTVVNRTKNQTFNIGAQNLAEINAAYPVPPQENVDANFHALAAASTDFSASCDGQSVECGANISLYNSNSQTFSDSTNLPRRVPAICS